MSIRFIEEYHRELHNLRRVSGSANEMGLRPAFQNLLTKYCVSKDLTLIPEEKHSETARPDGTIKDSMRLVWGHWEAKDVKDNLDAEITKKIKIKEYPTTNIIFENTETAVLFQKRKEILRTPMEDKVELDKLLSQFINYMHPAVAEFNKAQKQFTIDLPDVIKTLRQIIITEYRKNKYFRDEVHDFLKLCQETINPNVVNEDITEMLIQHILTKDIFRKVFDNDQFHNENNIAHKLEKIEASFLKGELRHDTVDLLKIYYSQITTASSMVISHSEKQDFLKAVYEHFYRIYNPDAADRLGVVYTPNEIVKFIINSTDFLVEKHFNKRLHDNNVHILDPATGTGTFIVDLLKSMPKKQIQYKYENEIHANEISILPYYIANLNIEHVYKEQMNCYKEFPNICFIDTLDNLDFSKGGGERPRRSRCTF